MEVHAVHAQLRRGPRRNADVVYQLVHATLWARPFAATVPYGLPEFSGLCRVRDLTVLEVVTKIKYTALLQVSLSYRYRLLQQQ